MDESKCSHQWVEATDDMPAGMLFTGKGDYSSNSVFFPACGCSQNGSVKNVGEYGDYWSSTPESKYSAYDLYFDEDGEICVEDDIKSIGWSVRAILAQ